MDYIYYIFSKKQETNGKTSEIEQLKEEVKTLKKKNLELSLKNDELISMNNISNIANLKNF